MVENHIEVIPNWYEDKSTSKIEESQYNELFRSIKKDGNLVVSYFGNMGIAQDFDTIVNAIRKFKDDNKIQFIFAGHGNKMDSLKNIIKNENLKMLLY